MMICIMVFIDVVIMDLVSYTVLVLLGAVQIGINVYIAYQSYRAKNMKLFKSFTVALVLNIAVTLTALIFDC